MIEKIKKIILISIVSILVFNFSIPSLAVMAEESMQVIEVENGTTVVIQTSIQDDECYENEEIDTEIVDNQIDENEIECNEVYEEEDLEKIIESDIVISYDNYYELNERIHAEESYVIESNNDYIARTYSRTTARLSIKDYIIQEARKGNSVIDISDYNIPFENMRTLMLPILYDEELFFASSMSWNGKYVYDEEGNKNAIGYQITLRLIMSEAEINKNYDIINQVIVDFIAGVKPEWNDLERLIYTSNYLCKKCEYSYANGVKAHTIAGALVDGKAVCDGYAKSLKYLLGQIGVNSRLVTSDEMEHAWNLVNIDGDYYHVDITWNDEDSLGKTGYKYFLLSDNALSSHYGWVADYKATNSKYDNLEWKNVNNYLIYNNDYWYYVGLGTDNEKINLYKIDFRNNINNVEYKQVQADKAICAPGLTSDGESLYFTTKSSIWKMNFEATEIQRVYTLSDSAKSLYSAEFVGDKLYYEVVNVLVVNGVEKVNINTRVTNICNLKNKIYTLLPVEKVSLRNVINFNINTQIASILNEEKFPVLNEYEILVVDDTGNKKQNLDRIGTKNIIQIRDSNGNILESYTAIVKGDITGNGLSEMEDIFEMLGDSIIASEDTSYDELDTKIRDYDGNGEVKMYDAFNFLKDKIEK